MIPSPARGAGEGIVMAPYAGGIRLQSGACTVVCAIVLPP